MSYQFKYFSVFSIITAVWSIFVAVSIMSTDASHLILIRIDHLLGTIIATTFLLFSITYPSKETVKKGVSIFLFLVQMVFVYLLFFTDTIVTQSVVLQGQEFLGWTYGSLVYLFDIQFVSFWVIGIYVLIRKLRQMNDQQTVKSLRLVIIALIVGIIPPAVFTVLLPQIGVYDYYWLSPVSTLIWILIVAYSITKHHFFNIKIIALELLTFMLWVYILIRTILSEDMDKMMLQGVMLIVTLIFGAMIIYSTFRDISQREKIEKLSNELKEAIRRIRSLEGL